MVKSDGAPDADLPKAVGRSVGDGLIMLSATCSTPMCCDRCANHPGTSRSSRTRSLETTIGQAIEELQRRWREEAARGSITHVDSMSALIQREIYEKQNGRDSHRGV